MLSHPNARCDRCLVPSPALPRDEDAARGELLTHFWELTEDGLTICLDCSRKRREVLHRSRQPGRRRWKR